MKSHFVAVSVYTITTLSIITAEIYRSKRDITGYRFVPVPECPSSAVCSEIYRLTQAEETTGSTFYNNVICKCGNGAECPTRPGTHTLSVTKDRWYGICDEICSYPKCEGKEMSEEIRIGAKDFGDRTYMKIHCICPAHESSELDKDEHATIWKTSEAHTLADIVFQYSCNRYLMPKSDNYWDKRTGRKLPKRLAEYLQKRSLML